MIRGEWGWAGVYACLPGTVDGTGHGNLEIQGSTVSAGPVAKDPINNVKYIQCSQKRSFK